MYSQRDVELILRMKELAGVGMPLAAAARRARSEQAEPPAPGAPASAAIRDTLTGALLNFDDQGASAAWSEAVELFDLSSIFERIVAPMMVEIGAGWHAGTVSVGQEHFATNFVLSRLNFLGRQVQPASGSPVVLLACLEGEHHELGLLMLAVKLRFQGLRTIYLGRDTPDSDLVRTIEDTQPQVVALSASTEQGARRLPGIVQRIGQSAPLTAVVYGGRAFEGDPALRPAGAQYGGSSLTAAAGIIYQLGHRARTGGSS
jgi:methanogenic corrinoid protein MtbC1